MLDVCKERHDLFHNQLSLPFHKPQCAVHPLEEVVPYRSLGEGDGGLLDKIIGGELR